MNSTGQLLNYYLDHQLKGYSKSTVSWVGSVQTLVRMRLQGLHTDRQVEFSFAMATGRWFDNHGARWLTIVGLTLATASVVSLACELCEAHAFRACQAGRWHLVTRFTFGRSAWFQSRKP